LLYLLQQQQLQLSL